MNRQMRKLFLSTIVGGALGLVSAGGAAWASASGEVQTLQPSTGWAISRIAANEVGSAPYCAMARKFGDNMILTFARNSKSEISVAVDFQRDALNTSQNYFTVLKPGYSQDRAFNVKPVSPKAMVIRMGSDQDFFDALGRSERLNIDLDGAQYSFVMPDMAGGLRDMRDCLSSVSTQARGGQAADAAQASEVDTRMDGMRPSSGAAAGDLSESDMASPENAAPVTAQSAPSPAFALDDMPPPAAAPVARVSRQQMADASPAVNNAPSGPSRADLDAARDENARLKNELAAARRSFAQLTASQAAQDAARSDEASKSAGMSAKLAELQNKNTDLANRLAQSFQQMRDAKAQLALAQQAAKQPVADTAKADKLSLQISQLQQQNDDLRGQLTQSASAAQAMRQQMQAQAAAQNAVAKNADAAASSQLNDRIADLEKQNDGLRVQLSQSAATAQAARAAAAKAQADAALKLAAAPPSCPSAKQASTAPDPALQAQLASLRDENRALREKAAAAPGPGEELAALKTENRHLKTEVDSLHSQLASIATLPPAASGDDQATIARLTSRIDQLQSENVALNDSLAKVQIDPGAATPDGMVRLSTLRGTEAQLAAARADRDNLQRKLDDIRAGKEDALLASAGKDWDLKKATQRYTESQREVDRLGRQMEADREMCVKEKKEAEYQLFDPRIATKAQIAKLSEVEKNLKQAQAQLAKRDSEAAGIRKDYETKIAALKQSLTDKQARLAAAQSEMDNARADYQGKLAAAQSGAAELAALKKQLSDKETQLAQAIAQTQGAKADYEHQLAAAKQDVLTRDKQLADARTKLTDLQKQFDGKTAAAQADGSQMAALQASTASLNAQLAAKDQQLAEARNKIDQIRKTYEAKLAAAHTAQQAAAQQVSQAAPDPSFDRAALLEEKQRADERVAKLEKTNSQLQSALASATPGAGESNGHVPSLRIVDDNAVAAASVAAAPVPVARQTLPDVPAVPGIEMASGAAKFSTPSSMEAMLATAGIRTSSDVRKLGNASGPDRMAMSWQIGKLFGSAEQRPIAGPGAFDSYVQQYLDKTRNRCSGQFAAVPGQTGSAAGVQTANYEIACVTDKGVGASASLLFYSRDGVFTSIAHESDVNGMDQGMDVRDRLASIVTASRLASR